MNGYDISTEPKPASEQPLKSTPVQPGGPQKKVPAAAEEPRAAEKQEKATKAEEAVAKKNPEDIQAKRPVDKKPAADDTTDDVFQDTQTFTPGLDHTQAGQALKTTTSTATNLTYAAIVHAAEKLKRSESSNIEDIQYTNNKVSNRQGVMVSFKVGPSDKVVRTYAEGEGNNQVKFSVQKNADEALKRAGIKEMCRLAVLSADENTVFNIPESSDDMQQFVEQCFKEGIADSEKFPEDRKPKIVLAGSLDVTTKLAPL